MSQYGISSALSNDLTAASSGSPKVYNFVWYDISDSVLVSTVDTSLNERVVVSDNSGPLSLVSNDGGDVNYRFAEAPINLVNDLFVDQDGDAFYNSYVNNYQSVTQTAPVNDLTLSNIGTPTTNDNVTLDVASLSNNNMVLNLGRMAGPGAGHATTISENHKIGLTTELDFLASANVLPADVSNNLQVNMYYLGAEVSNKNFNVGQTDATLSVTTNALTDNAKLVFTSDADVNNDEFDEYPRPSLLCGAMLNSEYSIGAGRRENELSIAVPGPTNGFRSGAWNWKVTVVDGDYTSAPVLLKLQVLPQFSAPVMSISNVAFNHDISKNIEFHAKYNPSDITNIDISASNGFMPVSTLLERRNSDGDWDSMPSDRGFLLEANGANNMDSVRDLDASANFILRYDRDIGKYLQHSIEHRLRVSYKNGIGGEEKFVNYPFVLTGVNKHNSAVVATNNYDGTYTLSGGNKATNEFYSVKVGSGNWSSFSLATQKTYTAPLGSSGNLQFGVSDIASSAYVFDGSKSVLHAFNAVNKVAVDISNGIFFNQINSSSVVNVVGDGEVTDVTHLVEGNLLVLGNDGLTDIYVNVAKPAWFNNTTDTNLKVTIEETPSAGVYNLTGYDLSCNLTNRSAAKINASTWTVTSDVSAQTFAITPSVNLKLREERLSSSVLLMTATVKAGGVSTTSSARFYVRATVPVNAGNNLNNLILPNRTKVNLTNLLAGSMTRLSAAGDWDVSENLLDDISTNSWRNLALAENAMMYAKLNRSEFVGPNNHVFDISGLKFTASSQNGNKVNAYFPFARYGNSLLMNDFDSDDVAAKFSNYADIFLDLDYFTGVLDIEYSTLFNSEFSATPNTLRLVVVPRPEVVYATIDPSQNIHRVGAPTWIRHSASNFQQDSGTNVTFNNNINAIGHTYVALNGLLTDYTRLRFSTIDVIDASGNNAGYEGPMDISDNLTNIVYGENSADVIKYKGIDIDNDDVSSNPHVLYFTSTVEYLRHALFKAKPVVSGSSDFKLYVGDDAERIFVQELVANDVFLSGNLALNNINFASYHVATENLNLTSDVAFHSTLNIVIENAGQHPITIGYSLDDDNNSNNNSVVLQFAQRGVFRQTDTNDHDWSYDGLI